jgi:hypothetical protein
MNLAIIASVQGLEIARDNCQYYELLQYRPTRMLDNKKRVISKQIEQLCFEMQSQRII